MHRCLSALLLLTVAGCSLTDLDGPRAGRAFQLSKRPAFACDAEGCGWSVTAMLTSLDADSAGIAEGRLGWVDLGLGDGTDVLRLYDARLADLPFVVGRTYTFEAELLATATVGWPSLRVTDGDGLVFYATSEFPLSRDVPPLLLPPGWSVTLSDGGYRRQRVFCGIQTTPQVLTVAHSGRSVRLVQGETAALGAYSVRALVAQRVDYSEVDCEDADTPELSLVVQRSAR